MWFLFIFFSDLILLQRLCNALNFFLLLLKASKLPMSIIIVGVGPAEFDGKCSRVFSIFLYLLTF